MTFSILVTGASGKTGQAVVRSLSASGHLVTAFVHHDPQVETLIALGAHRAIVGDLNSDRDLRNALAGNNALYHICPNMTDSEYEMGRNLLQLAGQAGIQRFVYHSVLHPNVEEMPHHWQKARVEALLYQSKFAYTILQPTAYLQNLQGYRNGILGGIYAVPYAAGTRIAMVDLRDVGDAAASVLKNQDTIGGTYELVGTPDYTQNEVASILSRSLQREVHVQVQDRAQWASIARGRGMGDYECGTLLAMFEYYENFGFTSSPLTLQCLLGREPRSLEQYAREYFSA